MEAQTQPLIGDTGAIFSPCRRWRYRLWRTWAPDYPRALFVLMNPSTADEVTNDPTIERCVRRVQRWMDPANGVVRMVGGVEICNVFAWRETDSRKLAQLVRDGVDIVGPMNDRHIIEAAHEASIIVCGWGQPGNLTGRGAAVLDLLRLTGKPVCALGVNADGTPQHPLYIGYAAPLVDV